MSQFTKRGSTSQGVEEKVVKSFMSDATNDILDKTIDDGQEDFISLNAQLNIHNDGKIQFDKDKQAARSYFLNYINPNTTFFYDLEEKMGYLVDNGYYDGELLNKYTPEFIKEIFKKAYSFKYRFTTFISALKFYSQYALKTKNGERFLERYEDRVVMNALYLGDGDETLALDILDNIINNRLQPATPTFLNAGLKNRGEKISCFLLNMTDDMESIGKTINNALQLSKRGGGVGINITNLREQGAPIKGVEGQSSGVIPVMKLYEDSFSYANQLGARQGAGAVYISCHHPDVMRVLDSKRENADEKVRIKTLSVGVVVSDIAFKLAKENKDMYLFSPYDVEKTYGVPMAEISITEKYHEMVENKDIRKKKINARKFFQTIAELQFESGYPYILMEDTANQFHYIHGGRISFSNLCSEILQVTEYSTFNESSEYDKVGRDISCNLSSINILKSMRTGNLGDTVNTSIRALTTVSDMSNIQVAPTVKRGNELTHSVGLGAMNLHGFLGAEKIHYGSDEALDFVNVFFATMRFHALNTSADIAAEKGETFYEFEKSGYKTQPNETHCEALRSYTSGVWLTTPQTDRIKRMFEEYGQWFPTQNDWVELEKKIQEHGLYHAYLLAVAPNGSISYVNNSTSSVHPITSKVEVRKESKIGRVYYPAPELTNDNMEFFEDAYTIGFKSIIDTYAVAQKHVDQAMSLTLFFKSDSTTRDLNRAYIYAFGKKSQKNEYGETALFDPRTSWKSGFIKTLYYSRIRQDALEGTGINECVSCTV